MKIAIVGTGYVGLVTGSCFAEMGIDVTCIDVNHKKIENLKNGIIPIFEPGLDEIVERNISAGRLHFSTSLVDFINNVEALFIAVGTPPQEDGSADLQHVLNVAKTIGQNLEKYILVVTKSTVPVGTSQKVQQTISEELKLRNKNIEFDVASNPEFLKEGDAVNDFLKPDRIVVGINSERAKKIMTELYNPFMINNFRIIFMDIASAEMTKYAANSMLATRISFMNDIANLCDLLGANVNMVRQGIGTDMRIGSKFLYSGCGYGGSCFPKDIKALIQTAKEKGYNMQILNAVEAVNDEQKKIIFKKLEKHFNGNLAGKTVAIWGLSFKPQTDDIREAPSIQTIKMLLDAKCNINVYDFAAIQEVKYLFGDKINYAANMMDATINADALLLITEWKEFRLPNWEQIKSQMKTHVIIDGRNIYKREYLTEMGFTYYGIGQ
ncbi:MAG: UDP-glucose/GDP-mannose dehydrogenase family protein [Prevotellaceae bacterium]|jgi:UDPglucose 6-dehydrogenase|nr:UDP-glucose/GDP-mannose dehydrogenase family protein [Prevotellaceae bacterium]